MGSSTWYDAINFRWFHCRYRRVTGYNFEIKLKISLVLENSVDPDEMKQYRGHCMLENPFRVSSKQRVK